MSFTRIPYNDFNNTIPNKIICNVLIKHNKQIIFFVFIISIKMLFFSPMNSPHLIFILIFDIIRKNYLIIQLLIDKINLTV